MPRKKNSKKTSKKKEEEYVPPIRPPNVKVIKPKVVTPKTDYKRQTLDWAKVYGKGDPHDPFITKLWKRFANVGLTPDDVAYSMGFARTKDNTYDANATPKALSKKGIKAFAKYPFKLTMTKSRKYKGTSATFMKNIRKIIQDGLKKGTIEKKQVEPTDEEYNAWYEAKKKKREEEYEQDKAYDDQYDRSHGVYQEPRLKLGRIVSEMRAKEKPSRFRRIQYPPYAARDNKNFESFITGGYNEKEYIKRYKDYAENFPFEDTLGTMMHPDALDARARSKYRRYSVSGVKFVWVTKPNKKKMKIDVAYHMRIDKFDANTR